MSDLELLGQQPESCSVCADDASLVEVVAAGPVDAVCVDGCGRETTVAVDLVGTVAPGDRLLVHAGVAIGRTE